MFGPPFGGTGGVSCSKPFMAPGETASFVVTAAVSCAVGDGAKISSAATVASPTTDANPSNNSATVTTTASNPPPMITGAAVDRPMLWPPNHKMVDVAVSYGATDNCDPSPRCSLSVASNEPVNGGGDGNTTPDWEIVDAHHVRLRAERAGTADGRVYSITITCTDVGGASSSQAVTVGVPHNQ